MSGISPTIYKRLRKVLSYCGPFVSDSELRAVFIDARISPWRNKLPQASNPASRVDATIDYLYNQHSDTKENALALLLRVLSDKIDPHDACNGYLIELASELEQATKGTGFEIESTQEPVQTLLQQLDTPIVYYAIAHFKGHQPSQPLYIGEMYILQTGIQAILSEGLRNGSNLIADRGEVIRFEIVVRVEAMEILPSWIQSYAFRLSEEPPFVEFMLKPMKPGRKEIAVEFYRQRHWFANLRFDVDVEGDQEAMTV